MFVITITTTTTITTIPTNNVSDDNLVNGNKDSKTFLIVVKVYVVKVDGTSTTVAATCHADGISSTVTGTCHTG